MMSFLGKTTNVVALFAVLLCFALILFRLFPERKEIIETEYRYDPIVISDAHFNEWLNRYRPYFTNLTSKLTNINVEGHIFQHDNSGVFSRKPQLYAYYKYVIENRNKIFHICETGFNGGHSVLFWALLFEGNIEITAFDLCRNEGCDIGGNEIRRLFPNIMLHLERGDSRSSILKYVKKYPEKKCNLISIDGGHIGDIPRKDIVNMRKLAAESHLVVMDDVNKNSNINWIKIPGIAWESAVNDKIICPLGECKPVFSIPNKKYPLRYCFGVYC